jgi:anti-sigma factor RsiW
MIEGMISEDDLQAYVDSRLDVSRSLLVEQYLEQNPGAAARIAAYIEQSNDLRAAFASAAVKPNLASIAEPNREAARRIRRSSPWLTLAAAILLAFLTGGSGGWLVRGQMAPPQLGGIPALTQEAVVNHLVYTEDHGRPVELAADQKADLVQWLSKRLNTPLKVPDLTSAGYRFMGGRLAATDHGPAAMLMYVDANGNRLTVFTRPMPKDKRDMKTIPVSADGVSGFAWICDGLGYSVLGKDNGGDLRSVADIVRHQVDPS